MLKERKLQATQQFSKYWSQRQALSHALRRRIIEYPAFQSKLFLGFLP